jgi:hypothetical protein
MHDTPIGTALSQDHAPANQGGSEEKVDDDIIILARHLSDSSNKEAQVQRQTSRPFVQMLTAPLFSFRVFARFQCALGHCKQGYTALRWLKRFRLLRV